MNNQIDVPLKDRYRSKELKKISEFKGRWDYYMAIHLSSGRMWEKRFVEPEYLSYEDKLKLVNKWNRLAPTEWQFYIS